ncbi:hypothetical protein AUEXF2481DRAFT_481394 [Aureobasidium subglaciale EXF-2481]|uniref:Uncharacterized protein n=1 Tax=Aureobasidium subglaciale (strain EXF-2481) TaxID=1043005 RepID=A0A074ZIG9_AURSE|nr:uncharacterized protein AUEXF2481DRAFT_481394 [Aureobasidium subglaciale EXF-2481]KEQ98351.1 hypothetical protein AUEXF2481DRAFT_481394 [Aureobasidium subglaciale EXF-2481]
MLIIPSCQSPQDVSISRMEPPADPRRGVALEMSLHALAIFLVCLLACQHERMCEYGREFAVEDIVVDHVSDFYGDLGEQEARLLVGLVSSVHPQNANHRWER